MARPRRSTQDEWLDEFADWPADVQEKMLDTCQTLHRQTKRRESRIEPAQPALPLQTEGQNG